MKKLLFSTISILGLALLLSCGLVQTVAAATATLTVKFPGIINVHTYVKVNDGVNGTATGGAVAEQTWKNDQAVFVGLPNGIYDVVVVKGAKQKIIDAVNCESDTCIVDGIVATLTVNFLGISNVHTYAKTTDGGAVDERTWKTDSTSMAVLKSTYKVVVVKGAQQKIIDAVNCESDTCIVDGIVATLTVKFPGISNVHTYAKMPDGVADTAGGGAVEERTWKNDQSDMVVLKGTYDIQVVKNSKIKVIDNVNCTGDTCLVDGIVATLTIKYPGMTGIHNYVKVPDSIDNSATGGAVDERTWQNNETALAVLRGFYDVLLLKGSESFIYDNVDCTGATCTLDKANLTVKFPGISSVHTYVRKSDGVTGSATGVQVAAQTWKTDLASFLNLPNGVYDVVVVKGSKTKIIDNVTVLGGWATVDKIVATLTVKFPGISSVHTYVKVNDGVVGTAAGGAVDERTWKNNESSLAVLKNTYDVVVVKGAKQKIIDAVNCESDTCTVDGIVSNVTLHFPGKTNVHVYFKVDDGVAGTAVGGAVDERTWKNNKAELVVLKNTYDIVVNLGGINYIVDAVDCTGNTAVYSLAIVKLINSSGTGIAGGVAKYYTGTWKPLGTTPASGALGAAIPGTPANILFSMDNNFVYNEKWQNIGTDLVVVFQTKNVEVQLKNSSDTLFDTGAVKFYTGAWHDLGNTSSGKVNVELLPANILFSMDNNFVHNEKWQDVGANSTVVFQTKGVEVQLKNSFDVLFDTGAVKFYTGAWHDLGNTSGGKVAVELLPANILFSMDNANVHNEKWQDTNSNAIVVFQTKNVVVQLQNHSGNALDTGTVKYYTGAWHDFGTTSGGQASSELLPANILFSMDYAFTHNEKWQNVDATPTVVFQTGQVKSGTGTCTQYYTGAWHAFTNDMELLPTNILFHFNDGTGDTWSAIIGGTENLIH